MSVRDRIAAIAAAGVTGAGDLEVLWDALGSLTKAEQRGAAEALAGLARRGQPVDELLARGLRDPGWRRRWGAAYASSLLGAPGPACIDVLLAALGDGDGDLRWASAAILCRPPVPSGLIPTLRGCLRSANPRQRKMALYCLRDLRAAGDGLDGELTAALDDPDPGVRLAAMAALVALAADRAAAAPRLARRLDDPDAGVRRAAAASLGRLGVRDAVGVAALRRACTSGDGALVRAASRALAMLEG